ncbi:MAG: 2-oxo-4-hydroxy-4-carboxy-5-ureidoimidazoline decarboxylase, partial [Rubrobacteraceae bacterium]
ELNRLYKEKFGIPMIFAVRDHTRDSILANARDRLENTTNEEEATALQEIFKIGRYRLEEAVE